MTSARRRGSSWSLRRIGGAALMLLGVASMAQAAGAQSVEAARTPRTSRSPGPQIDGWADDDHDAAFATFLKSCKAILQAQRRTRDGAADATAALYEACQQGGGGQSAEARRGARVLRAEFPPGADLAARRRRTDFSPAITSRSSRACAQQADGYDYPLYRKPANLLPGGRMAVARRSRCDNGKKKTHGPQAQARAVLRSRRDRRRRARRPQSGNLLAEGSDRFVLRPHPGLGAGACSTTAR